jgi:hypothetical protein
LKKSDPEQVGDILGKLTRSTPLGETLVQARIWEYWDRIAGPHLSAHGRPRDIKEGRLRIEVESEVWMHRFSFDKWRIIQRINRMARRELVSDIFFVLLPDGESLNGPE